MNDLLSKAFLIFNLLFILTMTNNVYANPATEKAVFAMGCFWCAESEFSKLEGVISVTSGYAGGTKPNPTYEDHSGYKEAIEIKFNPAQISYEKLLDVFWRNIDPFDNGGQFVDRGQSYTSAIYYIGSEQQKSAQSSKMQLAAILAKKDTKDKHEVKIVSEIIEFSTFYAAEEYHQDYKQKNPTRYKSYRSHSGREDRLEELWDQKD